MLNYSITATRDLHTVRKFIVMQDSVKVTDATNYHIIHCSATAD